MSHEARTALLTLSPAMATAAVFLLLSWKPWRRGTTAVTHGYWGGPPALGLGFLAAFYFVAGVRGFQLVDRWHWIAPIILAATAMGLIAALCRHVSGIRIASAVAVAIACGVLLHPPSVAGPALYWKIVLGVIVLASWISLEPIAAKRHGVTLPIALMMVFAGLSIVLLKTQQAGFSLLAAAIAAMCGVALIVSMLNPQFSFARGGVYVVAAALPALGVLGWLYNFSDVPIGPFVLILVSPMTLWLAEARFTAQWKPWQGILLRIMLAAMPIAAAVTWTLVVPASDTR